MSNIQETIQHQFGKVAHNYTTSKVHAMGEDLQKIAELVQEIRPKLALDAGCGAGHTTMAIAPHSEKVIAYDLTESMLEQVQQLAQERNLTNIETHLGNVAELPFADETFDVVASRYSAHHWSQPEKAIPEFFRVLKNGGQFILSDIVAFPDPTCDTFLQAIELLRDTSHVRDYSISQWHNLLQDVGFTCEVAFVWKLDLEFEAWVTRMSTPEQNIRMIQTLFDGAPQEVRQAFNVQTDYSFHIPGGIVGSKESLMEGKRFIITGGASGIGLATARLFQQQGAELILWDIQAESLAKVEKELGVHTNVVDITTIESLEIAMKQAMTIVGGLDGVVHCAGILETGLHGTVALEAQKRLIEVNLFGTLAVAQVAIPYLQQSKGSLILMASASAFYGLPEISTYGATKAGVVSFAQSICLEQEALGVHVGVVCPMAVDTPMVTQEHWKNVRLYESTGMAHTADEVARAIQRGIQKREFMIWINLQSQGMFWLSRYFSFLSHRVVRYLWKR